MEYLFNKCDMVPQKEMYATSEEEKVPVIPEYFYKKWMRQIITKHKDLSEEEKEKSKKTKNMTTPVLVVLLVVAAFLGGVAAMRLF